VLRSPAKTSARNAAQAKTPAALASAAKSPAVTARATACPSATTSRSVQEQEAYAASLQEAANAAMDLIASSARVALEFALLATAASLQAVHVGVMVSAEAGCSARRVGGASLRPASRVVSSSVLRLLRRRRTSMSISAAHTLLQRVQDATELNGIWQGLLEV
jgi:hypothetical protein